MYKKAVINEDYEYYELDEPVRRIDNELYVSQEGIEIGTNCLINYDANNNQITVLSLMTIRI